MSSIQPRFVAYYRVSTVKQGKSGLGLDAQRAVVLNHLGTGATIVAEFTEVESGRIGDRPQLRSALATARVHRIPIIVAKVDRLTRSVGFLSQLLESGVEVCFADLPVIEGPTGRFILQQMAAVAELEAGLISSRTKAALVAAKQRGIRLGGFRGSKLTDEARQSAITSRRNKAAIRARDLQPILRDLQNQGLATYSAIAQGLTARGIPTPRGCAIWSGVQVGRLLRSERGEQ